MHVGRDARRIVERSDVRTIMKAPRHPYTRGLLKSLPSRIGLLLEAVTRRQPELESRVVVSAIIDAAVDSLMWFTFVLIVIAVIAAVAAYAWERRDKLGRVSMETPPRTIGRWVRDNVASILAVGIGIIVVIALWSVGGPGIALLTAAALLLLFIAVKVLSDQADDEPNAAGQG